MIEFILFPFLEDAAFLITPDQVWGWAVIALELAVMAFLLLRTRDWHPLWNERNGLLLAFLTLVQIPAALFVGFRISPAGGLPVSAALIASNGALWMVFSAIPWVLAGGLLGPVAGLAVGLVSGLVVAFISTHTPFLALEIGLLGFCFGAAMYQPFRTRVFRALRQPVVAGALTVLLFPLIFVFNASAGAIGSTGASLDLAATLWLPASIAAGATILPAVILAQVVRWGAGEVWGHRGELQPSPAEQRLSSRMFSTIAPLVAVTAVLVAGLGWAVADRTGLSRLDAEMSRSGELLASGLQLSVDTGVVELERLVEALNTLNDNGPATRAELNRAAGSSTYFSELVWIGANNQLVESDMVSTDMDAQEIAAIESAAQGIPVQYYIRSGESQEPMLSFIANMDPDRPGPVLLARSHVRDNPYFETFFNPARYAEGLDIGVYVLDDQGQLLLGSQAGVDVDSYSDTLPEEEGLTWVTGADGARARVWAAFADGLPWWVIVQAPASTLRSETLQIAAPFIVLLVIFVLVLIVPLRLIASRLTASLQALSRDAAQIADNQESLAQPVPARGVDEVGQLSASFERMRVSLKGHLDSQSSLLLETEINRRRLDAILASSPDPVLVGDHRGRLLLANPAAQELLVSPYEDLVGRPWLEAARDPGWIDLMTHPGDELRSQEITTSAEKVYLAKSSPVLVEARRVGRVCVMRDVTTYKEIDRLKSELVNTVSHDLRNPLTLIRGHVTMLQMVGDLSPAQQASFNKIELGMDMMSRMVVNLLDLGRIEAGIDLEMSLIPLADVLEEVIESLQLLAEPRNIRLSLGLPPGSRPLVQADRDLLHRLVYNLVENAIKYSADEGEVEVRFVGSTANRTLRIEVQDSGIGIPSEDQDKLFEKFYRSKDRKARQRRGTGLGLAIVKSIAEAHGGRVWLESQLAVGTTFYFEMPVDYSVEGAVS